MKTFFYILLIFLYSSQTYAQVLSTLWEWISSYKVGISRAYVIDQMLLSYQTTNPQASAAKECKRSKDNESYYVCEHYIPANLHSGYGLFLQPAFVKKGLFYYGADISLGIRKYEGVLYEDNITADLPLKKVKFVFYGFNIQPYLQFGITPDQWPELILSFGPTAHWVWGTLAINDKKADTGFLGMLNWSGVNHYTAFVELELVLFRFGDGSFSLFTTNISGTNTLVFGEMFSNTVGAMENIKVNFSRNSAGIKFLLNWP